MALVLWLAATGPEPPTVVVLTAEQPGQRPPPMDARVRAELEAAGFAVVTYRVSPNRLNPENLEAALSAAGGDAATVVIRRSPQVVSVHVDAGNGSPRFERQVEDDTPTGGTAALVAVELVHAALSAPAPQPPQPPPPVPEKPPRPRWAAATADLRLGPYVGGSPGGFVQAGLALGGSWLPRPNLALEAELGATGVPARIDTDGGDIFVGFVSPRAHVSFVGWPTRRAGIRVGPSGGAVVQWATARAEAGFDSRTQVSAGGLVGGRAALWVRLTRRLRLDLDARASALFPRGSITFDGAEVTTFGHPLLEGFVSIAWLWARD